MLKDCLHRVTNMGIEELGGKKRERTEPVLALGMNDR